MVTNRGMFSYRWWCRKRLYSSAMAMDAGTLYQLGILINRRNVSKDPSSKVSASDDFFLSVAKVHILSACMTVFEMNNKSSERFFSQDSEKCYIKRRVLLDAVNIAMDKYVDFAMGVTIVQDNSERDHVYT